MPVSDSDRGTSVKLEIIQIASKKILYNPDIAVEGKDDPILAWSKYRDRELTTRI